jgi:hypothetical protein
LSPTNGAAFDLAEDIGHQHVAFLQHVDDALIAVVAQALRFASASLGPLISGRAGMNCTVTARPISFFSGCRILEVAFVLIAVAFARQNGPDFLGREPSIFCQELVVHFGAAVGKAVSLPLLGVLEHLLFAERAT